MSFKEASKQKLRFNTSRGPLSTEQLWDLPLTELDALAVALETEVEKGGVKSFLTPKTPENKIGKLKFDVVYEMLTTRVEENQAAQEAADNKAHNQKILGLMAEKQEEGLKKKSLKELEKMLK